jgi:hypothetical protein
MALHQTHGTERYNAREIGPGMPYPANELPYNALIHST